MLRFVAFRREPASKCRRQISVDEKLHRSEAAKTG
jgi:hypothetical protein